MTDTGHHRWNQQYHYHSHENTISSYHDDEDDDDDLFLSRNGGQHQQQQQQRSLSPSTESTTPPMTSTSRKHRDRYDKEHHPPNHASASVGSSNNSTATHSTTTYHHDVHSVNHQKAASVRTPCSTIREIIDVHDLYMKRCTYDDNPLESFLKLLYQSIRCNLYTRRKRKKTKGNNKKKHEETSTTTTNRQQQRPPSLSKQTNVQEGQQQQQEKEQHNDNRKNNHSSSTTFNTIDDNDEIADCDIHYICQEISYILQKYPYVIHGIDNETGQNALHILLTSLDSPSRRCNTATTTTTQKATKVKMRIVSKQHFILLKKLIQYSEMYLRDDENIKSSSSSSSSSSWKQQPHYRPPQQLQTGPVNDTSHKHPNDDVSGNNPFDVNTNDKEQPTDFVNTTSTNNTNRSISSFSILLSSLYSTSTASTTSSSTTNAISSLSEQASCAKLLRTGSKYEGQLPLHMICQNYHHYANNFMAIHTSPSASETVTSAAHTTNHADCDHHVILHMIEYLIKCHPAAICTTDALYENIPLHYACITTSIYHRIHNNNNTDTNYYIPDHHSVVSSSSSVSLTTTSSLNSSTLHNNIGKMKNMASSVRYITPITTFSSTSLELIIMLLQHFKDGCQMTNKDGNLPLHLACYIPLVRGIFNDNNHHEASTRRRSSSRRASNKAISSKKPQQQEASTTTATTATATRNGFSFWNILSKKTHTQPQPQQQTTNQHDIVKFDKDFVSFQQRNPISSTAMPPLHIIEVPSMDAKSTKQRDDDIDPIILQQRYIQEKEQSFYQQYQNQLEIVQYLVNVYPEALQIKNHDGHTPYQIANQSALKNYQKYVLDHKTLQQQHSHLDNEQDSMRRLSTYSNGTRRISTSSRSSGTDDAILSSSIMDDMDMNKFWMNHPILAFLREVDTNHKYAKRYHDGDDNKNLSSSFHDNQKSNSNHIVRTRNDSEEIFPTGIVSPTSSSSSLLLAPTISAMLSTTTPPLTSLLSSAPSPDGIADGNNVENILRKVKTATHQNLTSSWSTEQPLDAQGFGEFLPLSGKDQQRLIRPIGHDDIYLTCTDDPDLSESGSHGGVICVHDDENNHEYDFYGNGSLYATYVNQ